MDSANVSVLTNVLDVRGIIHIIQTLYWIRHINSSYLKGWTNHSLLCYSIIINGPCLQDAYYSPADFFIAEATFDVVSN